MKKFTYISAAFLALTSFFATAQINQTPVHTGGGQITTSREKSQSATGSMFTNEKYMPAKLSTTANTVLLRYNAYSDNFEMNNPQEGQTKILPKDPNTQITFVSNNETYALVKYKTEKGETVNGYLNVISDNNKVKFYKRERVYLQPEVFPANSYQTYKPANYKKSEDEFYVKIDNNEAVFIDGKKDLAKLIPGKDKEVLDYIKKNKLAVDKEQDLEKLATYIGTIL